MSTDKSKDQKSQITERRVDHLVNLVDKQTRTERHLEEHSDISKSPENIEHAKQINEGRQNEIEHLKNILAHGENYKNDHKDNTERRFVASEGYLNHNAEHMDNDAFRNVKVKQGHRKEQLDQFK